MFSDWVRRSVFWSLDFLKDGKTYKNLKEIREINTKPNSEEEIMGFFNHLCKHTLETVPYYAGKSFTGLEDFPIIDKLIIKDNFDSFLSLKYKGKRLHKMSTSGSTGIPFYVLQNKGKRKRLEAEIIYFNEICGQRLGKRFIFFRVWNENNRKSKWQSFKQNLLPINILDLSDDNFEDIRQLLKKDKSINSCLAYASTYEYLVDYLERCGDNANDFALKAIVSGAAILTDEVKLRLEKMFGCTVVSRYSNQENGILAQQKTKDNIFKVNNASYIIEILKHDSDEKASVGESGRVVVTDLFNFSLPIIRYDTGDLAILNRIDKKEYATELRAVQGRLVDVIYNTKGKPLTPLTMSVYMWNFNKVKQYQFIQKGEKEYYLKIIDNKNHMSLRSLKCS